MSEQAMKTDPTGCWQCPECHSFNGPGLDYCDGYYLVADREHGETQDVNRMHPRVPRPAPPTDKPETSTEEVMHSESSHGPVPRQATPAMTGPGPSGSEPPSPPPTEPEQRSMEEGYDCYACAGTGKLDQPVPDDAIPHVHCAACHDCGRCYGDEHGFPDLIVPPDVWNAHISPSGNEGGLLCPSCMVKRATAAGLRGVPAAFKSGPFVLDADRLNERAWERRVSEAESTIASLRTALSHAEQERDEGASRADEALGNAHKQLTVLRSVLGDIEAECDDVGVPAMRRILTIRALVLETRRALSHSPSPRPETAANPRGES